MENPVMAAGEFKAKCLAIMDEVRDKRVPITITKNGKPVVRVVPCIADELDTIFGSMRDSITIVGDITAPIYTDDEWEDFFRAKAAKYESAEALTKR
jgi:prevent-host-death family protein